MIGNLNLHDLPESTRNRVKTYVCIRSKEIKKKIHDLYIRHKGPRLKSIGNYAYFLKTCWG